MPIDPDPSSLSDAALQSLHDTLRAKLVATSVLVRHVGDALRDPKSLDAATDLLRSTLAFLDRPGSRARDEIVREANLSNATLLAVIDLVKSHADAPKARVSRAKNRRS
jgi:hypothetical protein